MALRKSDDIQLKALLKLANEQKSIKNNSLQLIVTKSKLAYFPKSYTVPISYTVRDMGININLPAGEKIQSMQHIREIVLLASKYLVESSMAPLNRDTCNQGL